MRSSRNTIQFGRYTVGAGHPVFVIAEAGVAHFGSIENAFKLVDMAVAAKADAVKFQIFKTDSLISHVNAEWRERLRPKELPYDAFKLIKTYCEQCGILFLATAHEEESADFLATLDVPVYKIGSGEVGNLPYFAHLASKGKPLIISTGLHDEAAIQAILDTCHAVGNRDIALLHCNTAYPTPVEQSNLRTLAWLAARFKVPVGYSDHTIGTTVPLAAVALGACILEKHICIDKNTAGSQDCRVSCDAEDLPKLVQGIRDIEAALGSEKKIVANAAQNSFDWARKSLVMTQDLPAGAVISAAHLVAKRPGTGITPARVREVIGKKLRCAVQSDTLLRWEDFEVPK